MAKIKPKYHLSNPSTDIYVGDNRKILQQLPAESVDLIFADPPFNWEVTYEEWDDNLPRKEYLSFTYEWIDACLGVLAPHGSIWINIPDDTAAEVAMHLKKRGLHMINWCIWHFRFGQYRNGNFIVSKAHVLYFSKDRNTRIWNADQILEPSDRATTYADARTRRTRNPGRRVPFDVWYGSYWGRIQGNNLERRAGHQNQIPEFYMERIIRACSNPKDLVLDPFLGSGTTCLVAKELKRKSIGIELSKKTASSAYDRIIGGTVRLLKPIERVIRNAFFATHNGYSTDEVIINDKLRRAFLVECKLLLKKENCKYPGEYECNRTLENMRKAKKLGPLADKSPRVNINKYECAKRVAVKLMITRSRGTSIDRIMQDPELRKNFDKQARLSDSEVDTYLVRKAVLNLRRQGRAKIQNLLKSSQQDLSTCEGQTNSLLFT